MIALRPRYLDLPEPPWAQISRRTISTEVTSSPSLIVFSPRFNIHPLVHRNLWSVNCHLYSKTCLWQLKISIPKQVVIWGVWLPSPWTLCSICTFDKSQLQGRCWTWNTWRQPIRRIDYNWAAKNNTNNVSPMLWYFALSSHIAYLSIHHPPGTDFFYWLDPPVDKEHSKGRLPLISCNFDNRGFPCPTQCWLFLTHKNFCLSMFAWTPMSVIDILWLGLDRALPLSLLLWSRLPSVYWCFCYNWFWRGIKLLHKCVVTCALLKIIFPLICKT